MKRKVAILCGGRSHERAVSLRTGARVEQALLAREDLDVTLIDVDERLPSVLEAGRFDVAFIALHGRGGEDDQVQALCELLRLPYTGTRNGPCGAAFDKARAKRLLLAAGVPTPPFITFSEHAIEQFGAGDVREEAEQLGYPLVVKPARSGSSLGTRFVDDPSELARALIGALSYDQHVLLERHVQGRELSVTILGDGAGVPRVLPAVEIVPRHADWFDYESRYSHGETEFTCPPIGMDDGVLERAHDAALAAYEALDISGYGRADLIVDETGNPWLLEVSPVPGLTETSLVSIALDYAGIELSTLAGDLIDDAIAQGATTGGAGHED
jgi:D-alanine-D-alanine ligase